MSIASMLRKTPINYKTNRATYKTNRATYKTNRAIASCSEINLLMFDGIKDSLIKAFKIN